MSINFNNAIEKKEEIGNLIYKFEIEENDKKKLIEKKYKEKFNLLKKNMKDNVIKNLDWVQKIKEKYINNIEDIIHNYYQ